MRIAVIAGLGDSEWSEETLVVHRMAGALACEAEVEILVADGTSAGAERRGAFSVRRFEASYFSAPERAAYLRAAFGFHDPHHLTVCGCAASLGREIARSLPQALQNRLADLVAPPSTDLEAFLSAERYDVVVAAGHGEWRRLSGLRGTRRVLAPLAREEPSLHLPLYDDAFTDADAIVVFSDAEETLVRERAGASAARVVNVGFALRVEASSDAPDGRPELVVARDWRDGRALAWAAALGRRLSRRAADAGRRDLSEVQLIGPGAGSLPELPGVRASVVRSRRDVEAWMRGATAVIDPEPHRLLGRDVVEATMLGTPVVVTASGGATRDHAEASDGGLWYRSDAELDRCLELLADPTVRAKLGAQGRAYAERRYGDPDAFIRRVTEAVAG